MPTAKHGLLETNPSKQAAVYQKFAAALNA